MMMAMASKRSPSRNVSKSRSKSKSSSSSNPNPVRLPKELDILPPRPVLFPWLPSIDIFGCCWGGEIDKQLEEEAGVSGAHSLLDETDGESTCSSRSSRSNTSSHRSSRSNSSSRRSRSSKHITEWIEPPRRTERSRRIMNQSKRRSRSKRKSRLERNISTTPQEQPSKEVPAPAPAPAPAPSRVLSSETTLTVELLSILSDLSGSIPSPRQHKDNELASSTAGTATTKTSTSIDDTDDDSASSVPDMASIGDCSELENYHSTISSSPTHPWDEAPNQEPEPNKTADIPIITTTTQMCHNTPLFSLTDVVFMVLQMILQALSVRTFLFGDDRKQTQDIQRMLLLEDERTQHQDSCHGRILDNSAHQRDSHEHW